VLQLVDCNLVNVSRSQSERPDRLYRERIAQTTTIAYVGQADCPQTTVVNVDPCAAV
jgi:hypothetical protein